jgi:hypothetical protein
VTAGRQTLTSKKRVDFGSWEPVFHTLRTSTVLWGLRPATAVDGPRTVVKGQGLSQTAASGVAMRRTKLSSK